MPNIDTNKNNSLFSSTNYVEAPFIWVEIGGVTLGKYNRVKQDNIYYVDYPDMVVSLDVQKMANAVANIYTLKLTYTITENSDPNLVEKLLSKAKKDGRKIKFSYGDYQNFAFAYKEEEALITKAVPSMSVSTSRIDYTITAVSASYKQSQSTFTFGTYTGKPSDRIKEICKNPDYGIQSLFPGMTSDSNLAQCIDSDDANVTLEAKYCTVIEYICYCVNSMRYQGDPASKKSIYKFAIYDDLKDSFNGTYFQIRRITSNSALSKANIYPTVDVGYPAQGNIIDFQPQLDEAYSILYDYDNDVKQNRVSYSLDKDGNIVETKVEMFRKSTEKPNEATSTWWAELTNFPFKATLVIKGLLKNIQLIDKININVLFYGNKHIYSGIYTIIGQKDSISANGYRTELSLMRTSGEEL